MDPSAYERWFEVEQHFWRVGRRQFLIELIGGEPPEGAAGERPRVLDIGGACSILSQELKQFGDVVMVEPDAPTAAFAREQFGLDVRVGRLPHELGVEGPFDLITLFDVIEHVEDDLAALETARRLLRPGGKLVVTVPALMMLWGDHDVANHHFRRYEKAELRSVIERAGFRISRLSFFISLLFPLIYAERAVNQLRGINPKAQFDVKVPPKPINRAMLAVMTVERMLMRKLNMPIGSSLVAVCHRD